MRVHKRAKAWLRDFRSHRFHPAVVVRDEEHITRFEAHVEAVKNRKADPEDVIKNVFGKPIVDGTF
jgi:hypothetical protein